MLGAAIAVALAAGFGSSLHCAAMCGPLAAFAARGARGAAAYHGARLAAYALAGGLAGATGTLLADAVSARWAGALLSWSLALALALTAWRLWRGEARRTRLVSLGDGRPSLARRLFERLPRHPAVVGGLTALLPCGALYAALLIAASSGDPLGGALAMLAFGAASALGLGAFSFVAARLRRRLRATRSPGWPGRALAAVLLVGAVLLVVRPIGALQHDAPPQRCGVER